MQVSQEIDKNSSCRFLKTSQGDLLLKLEWPEQKKNVQNRIQCIYDIPVYLVLKTHPEHLLMYKVLYLKFSCHSCLIYVLGKLNIVV